MSVYSTPAGVDGILIDGLTIYDGMETAHSKPAIPKALAVQRDPADPVYSADLTLNNVTGQSRYWIANASDLTQVLATGLVPGDIDTTYDHVISSVPAYGTPFLMEIRIRNATGATKYEAFKTFANHSIAGASAYIIQNVDPVA